MSFCYTFEWVHLLYLLGIFFIVYILFVIFIFWCWSKGGTGMLR